MVPLAAVEPSLADRRDEARGRAMKQARGRLAGLEPELDRDRVALGRPDVPTLGRDREALLVVVRDHALELGSRGSAAMAFERGEQLGDRHPTSRVEREPDRFGLVAEQPGEQLAELLAAKILPSHGATVARGATLAR